METLSREGVLQFLDHICFKFYAHQEGHRRLHHLTEDELRDIQSSARKALDSAVLEIRSGGDIGRALEVLSKHPLAGQSEWVRLLIDLRNPVKAGAAKRKAELEGSGYIADNGVVTWFDANPGMFGLD